MVILGIDPGTAHTGYGVIKVPEDILQREFKYDLEFIAAGNIVTPKEKLAQDRLLMLHDEMNHLLKKYQPEALVIEMLFFGANTKTAISVGQARGVILLSAAQFNVPVTEYTGLQVKLMVAGAGRADKKEVHENVRRFLGSNGHKRSEITVKKGEHLDDATDALAIAICHVLKLAAK